LRQIPSRLQIHPQSRGRAKGFSQVKRGIRRHSPLAANEFIESRFRPSDISGKSRLRNLPWLQEFLQENLPGDETDLPVVPYFFCSYLGP
jgi:hypothetical protein